MAWIEMLHANKWRVAVATLRFAYYCTGILTFFMFILPIYSWFIYLRPHFGYLLTGPESVYVAAVSIFYGVSCFVATAVLIVLHGLGEKLLLNREPEGSDG
ncbi:MAG: hypothetical protein WDZ29_07720 [Balneolaceae bacterium]